MNQLERPRTLPDDIRTVFCYTDGSASVKGEKAGYGGFGTYFPNKNGDKKPEAYSAGYYNTKTGRMEVTALLFAITNCPKECHLVVYSDSEYVVKSFTEGRLLKWRSNDWTSYGSEVKNVDLWKRIILALEEKPNMILTLRWLKGHQVDKEKDKEKKQLLLSDRHIYGNTVADRLADYKRHTNYKKDLETWPTK